jgi:tetratricopeptide (TPR) repeat protein
MSFDKIKAMRSAERYLSQGKIRAAIGEYKQIVEHDPKDFSTLNILGDLYTKNAEKGEAVACFKRVAEYYGKQGFAQKAIAVYNKISRLQPNSAEVSAKLAELHQMKGSVAEARSHYVMLAEQYERTGKKTEALAIWKQIAELDPKNTEVYLKIAESYLKEEQVGEAAQAFIAAAERLSAQGKYEDALKIFARALEIKQNDLKALNGYVKAQISLGDTDEAAKTLEQILEKQPSNRDVLFLLIDCYLDTNNPQGAETAVIKLVEQEPANYPKFLELVGAYLRAGDLSSAARILSISSEHLLVVRYYGWQRDENELRQALERLAEGARLAESIEDERYALSQLVMIVPHEAGYASRLQEINSQYDFSNSSFEPSILGQPLMIEQYASEATEFEDYSAIPYEKTSDNAPEFAANDFGEYQTDFAAPDNYNDDTKDFVFSGDTFSAKIVEEFNEDEYGSFGKTDSFFDQDFGVTTEKRGTNELSVSDELKLEKELESIEFYVSQGYRELAEKSLIALEEEYGKHPQIAALREEISNSRQFGDEEMSQVKIVEDAAKIVAENSFAGRIAENSGREKPATKERRFDFISDFQSELGFEETESAKDDDYETHYHMAIAYKEMGLMEDSIREFQDAINLVTPNDGTRRFFACAHLLGHCFMEKKMPNLALMWYKRALETENLTNEEKQGIWYEIGSAYEAGGDSEKAIENFGMVYAINVNYRDVSQRIQTLHVNS